MQSTFEIDVFLSRKSQDAHLGKEINDFLDGLNLNVLNFDPFKKLQNFNK